MPEARATIIVEAKDEASAVLGKIGAAGEASGKKTKDGFGGAIKELTGFNVASLAGVGAITAVGGALAYAVGQAAEAEKIMAQTQAVIKSTGGAAGLTAEEISKMAGALSNQTTFADDAIQKGQNLLLTFTNIGKDVFPDATKAMLDMATAMGTDASSGAIQLGKALNDPTKGITALTRVGVVFTAEQKEMIRSLQEAGDVAGAQRIILEELNKEFGGSAAAQLDTYSGKLEHMKNSVDNLAESMGGALIPILSSAVDGFDSTIKVAGVLYIQYMDLVGAIDSTEAAQRAAALASGDYAAVLTEQADAVETNVDAHERGADVQAHLRNEEAKLQSQTSALNSVWQGYSNTISDGAQDANKAAEAIAAQRQAMRDAETEAQALAAGLSGVLAQAYEDYNTAVADTQPTIEDLRAENARLVEEQGALVTVTTEATTTQAEYDLALQKAAEAQTKLNENTDPEKVAQLTVNVEKANEKLNDLAGGFGSSSTYAIDNAAAIEENKQKMAELYDAQQKAEEQLKKTTAQFVYQQISADLDAGTQLELARSLGLMDEASYDAAKAALELRQEFDDGKISAEEMAKGAKTLADELAKVQSKEVTVTTNYVTNGQAGGQQGSSVGGGTIFAQAHGGNVYAGVPTVVGDSGRPELFVPQSDGYVYPVAPSDNTSTTGGMNVNVYVSGITDPVAVGREVKRQLDEIGRSGDRRMRT